MVKEIYLTHGMAAIVDEADYDFLNRFLWFAMKRGRTYYAYTKRRLPDGKRINLVMHRVILDINDPRIVVDHKDHNGLNNTRANIRACTIKENFLNRSAVGKSKYLGVDWQPKRRKWRARISIDGKRVTLGDFDTEIRAAMAYNDAAISLHKEFASLNTFECQQSILNSEKDLIEKVIA